MTTTIFPTDQTASANSNGAGQVTDDAQADPAFGARANVTITVTATYANDGGTSSVRYATDGATFTNVIRSVGDNGAVPEEHTDTVSLGNIDITLLAIQARAFAGPGFTADVGVTAWNVKFSRASVIVAE